jgi:hypothetical protein
MCGGACCAKPALGSIAPTPTDFAALMDKGRLLAFAVAAIFFLIVLGSRR